MIRKYILPLLAVLGLALGITTALAPVKLPALAAPLAEPARPPFAKFVAGSGIVESASENIAIAPRVSGVVTDVFVKPGTKVKAGDPLFALDSREKLAEIAVRRAAVKVGVSRVEQTRQQFDLWKGVTDRRAVSEDELITRKYAFGSAEAELELRQRELEQSQTDLDLLTARAPIDGEVLQVKVHPGEFAPANVVQSPLILLGSTNPLHLRVDVDEADAWRIGAAPAARAFVRGNSELSVPLTFVRFEPYVIPKRTLTGESTERVDTRVLQMIFRLETPDFPLFVGQLMDVFIEAQKNE